MPYAVDLSNHQSRISPQQVAALLATGVTKAIVGLQYPGRPYPPGVAHQQLQTLIDGGMPHIEVYFESTPCERAWGNVAQFKDHIERAWVAAETGSAFEDNTSLDAALAFADALGLPKQAGIYSAAWWWGTNIGADWYKGRPLWVAHYDSTANLTFSQFGGWQTCEMKQYSEHGEIPGLGFEVDLNYYEDAPPVAVPPPIKPPEAQPAISPAFTEQDVVALEVLIKSPLAAKGGVAIIPQERQANPPRRVYRIELPN
jgi:hypothetical protein